MLSDLALARGDGRLQRLMAAWAKVDVPGWARQNPAKGGEQEAVNGLPAGAADLAFENSELVK